MTYNDLVHAQHPKSVAPPIQIIRHAQVCKKLAVSSATLFDMIAKGNFPKPFTIIPNGRAVGWLEGAVDEWIMQRSSAALGVMS